MLTGACISRAGLNRKTGLATLTLVLAAEAPDLDILLYFRNPLTGFAHHRGLTHSFVGVPLVAAFVTALVYGFHRLRNNSRPAPAHAIRPRPRWGLLFIYACLGGLSHILLDFTNSYGVRPLEPFSYRWHSWDIVSIVEPLILLALIAGLGLPVLFGLISEEIGARHHGPRGRGAAIVALLAVVAVWGVRDYQHRHALAAMQSLLYHGAEPVRISAYPYATNPFVWHGVVETSDFFEMMQVDSLNSEVDPGGGSQTRYKPEETAATLAAKKSNLGRVYLDWAAYPITEQEPQPEGGYVVRFYDLRYLYPERSSRPLSAVVQLDPQLKVAAVSFAVRSQAPRVRVPTPR